MQIDTDDVKTTAQAAAELGMKPGELTAFVKKHEIEVPRLGKMYLWTERVVEHVGEWARYIKDGRCVHCTRLWDRPEPDRGDPPGRDAGEGE